MMKMKLRPNPCLHQGVTLIELVIVIAIVGILLSAAVPSYRNHMLRVHRTEAIRMLLQASMCQERINASRGRYDTSLCQTTAEQPRYQLAYRSPNTRGQTYVAMALPQGAQLADPCGSLSLDQNGARSISADNMNLNRCWNGQ